MIYEYESREIVTQEEKKNKIKRKESIYIINTKSLASAIDAGGLPAITTLQTDYRKYGLHLSGNVGDSKPIADAFARRTRRSDKHGAQAGAAPAALRDVVV